MKKSIIFLFALLMSCHFLLGQAGKDSIDVSQIYAPQSFENLSAEESWEIHKAAFLKKMENEGLTDEEIKNRLIDYEKKKEAYIAKVKEQLRLAAIQREKAAEQRRLANIQRKKAAEQRKLADIQRKKAEELRKLAAIEMKKAAEQRGKNAIQRQKAEEMRKQADLQRAKAAEQRRLADIQRKKAAEMRRQAQEWRKNTKDILIKNIVLTKQSTETKPILFNVTSKTTLRIGIRAHISSGTALIEVYNPQGIKEGELSLNFKSENNSNNEGESFEYTSGSLDKTILGAGTGEWQIKISSKEAEGTVAMSVGQYIKSTLDD